MEDQSSVFTNKFDLVISRGREKCIGVERALKYKDLSNISDKKYTMIRRGWHLEEILPSLVDVRAQRKKLNELFPLSNYENGKEKGVFVNIGIKVKYILAAIKNRIGPIEDNLFTLKLTGDGTNFSYNMKLFNICFSVVNDKARCKTSSGTFIIGSFEIEEKYEVLEKALSGISNQLENLTEVVYEDNLKNRET